ncbi:hypothetical protein P775_06610 [Puniceibacterium antarcticum]|uniref:Metal-dependent carboxypeptidase n=1 Tax=Puniceibacterium antarcticum TaxID=1206336 RepID=A0A2G8RHH5_9RHOB|nr:carboxypeptidase M32 [Puniceibacterium antarcticum]PIL21035.1 hypothetical protein P775_06610 [Puniceibacterium antarcticum]
MSDTLQKLIGPINDVLCAVNALEWDARVMMPRGGAETRGHQIATLKGLARGMILDPALRDAALEAAESSDDLTARAGATVLDAQSYHSRMPADLLRRRAEGSALAGAVWAEARAASDFKMFQPYLERMVDLCRETAEAVGYDAHPYDAMVNVFEPGETAASLDAYFNELRDGIRPLLDQALGRPPPRTDFLYRHFQPEIQKVFAHEIAEWLGYDFTRGRLDTAVHPFEISQTSGDVRITSRWRADYLPMSIFGTIHEVGHALYEQGAGSELTRGVHATDLIGLYAVAGTSFGMHESQSRLLENHVGRTPAFWRVHFGRLRDLFPEQLGDVTENEFVAAVNRVEPGFIRVEADELTYDLHIMLRVRLEMALMEGSLSVADLPAAWNEAIQADLGLKVPSDAMGCLQDVHWSHGYMGSFPTYTIGNATAAQVLKHLRQTGSEADASDPALLRAALGQGIWRHGRSRSRTELLVSLDQCKHDTAPYLAYLAAKFHSLA